MAGLRLAALGVSVAPALLTALLTTQCTAAMPGRYESAVDPGSRYRFTFARDRVSGQWVHREFEIRVKAERPLPPLQVPSEIGNSFSVQLFQPDSVSTAGIFSAVPQAEGGYLLWRGADVADDDDVRGRVAYGVSVSWPDPGRETKFDPMEIFALPPLGDTVPEQWTAWATADAMRAGAFGWWEEAHGHPSTPMPAPAQPFEFRWRLVFAEIPGRIP